jgi:hypothetical protein
MAGSLRRRCTDALPLLCHGGGRGQRSRGGNKREKMEGKEREEINSYLTDLFQNLPLKF